MSVHRVSIHAPAGGATRCVSLMTLIATFQSTRPQGARRASIMLAVKLKRFQSTRPQGARPLGFFALYVTRSSNPRARRGRDK